MALIFISVASKTAVNGKHLTSAFLEDMAKLHDKHPEHAFLCPMIQGYALLPYLEDSVATWQVWGDYCTQILKACDEVWVLLGDGWKIPISQQDAIYNSSEGVFEEIKLAYQYNKRLVFFDTNSLYD